MNQPVAFTRRGRVPSAKRMNVNSRGCEPTETPRQNRLDPGGVEPSACLGIGSGPRLHSTPPGSRPVWHAFSGFHPELFTSGPSGAALWHPQLAPRNHRARLHHLLNPILPLPAGEGRGEGERVPKPNALACSWNRRPAFGFRASDFFRISGFGFRTSFVLRPSSFVIPRA